MLLSAFFVLLAAPFALSTCPEGVPCLKKCCPMDKKIGPDTCVPHNGDGPSITAPDGVTIVLSPPKCTDYLVNFVDKDEHTVYHNGSVLYNGWMVDYCRDLNHDNVTATYVCEEVLYRQPNPHHTTPHSPSQAALKPRQTTLIFIIIAAIIHFVSSHH